MWTAFDCPSASVSTCPVCTSLISFTTRDSTCQKDSIAVSVVKKQTVFLDMENKLCLSSHPPVVAGEA